METSNQPLHKVLEAIEQTTIPRHEWNQLQGSCHKRGCNCNTFWNGDAEEALKLVIACVQESVQSLYILGKTKLEMEIENATQHQM